MQLKEKLASLTPENTVTEINQMLLNTNVRISYTGMRLLSVTGLEGEVTLNEFATAFLKARGLCGSLSPSLEERLAADQLWKKIKELYKLSDKKLNNSYTVFRWLTQGREFKPYCRECAGDPQAIITGFSHRDKMFWFSKEDYKKYFGDEKSNGWAGGDLIVSRVRVEEALKESQSTIKMSA